MALVTVQRSPSPSRSAETEEQDVLDTSDSNLKSPRQRREAKKWHQLLDSCFLKSCAQISADGDSFKFKDPGLMGNSMDPDETERVLRLIWIDAGELDLKISFSESYFTVKGAAVILPQSDEAAYTRKVTSSHAGDDIQTHLQAMFSLLRPQDTIKVAVKLEGTHTRYLIVVSCIGRQDTEESVILGIDLLEKASIGLILPVWAHMHIQLDGDGGFSVKSDSDVHIFKPVSVQAMWSALQSLNKVVKIAKDKLYIPRGLTHTWVGYYEAKLTTETVVISEWNATADIDRSYRTDKNLMLETSGEEDIYKRIRLELKNVMMTVDLEEVTCLFLRRSIEEKLGMDLKKYKSFIDTEMMEILGQMDSPSKILDHLYLGSEWNASNLEELQHNGVHHILNISREIDNFFPGILHYMNVREWDVDQSDLLKYWEDTHRYINKARRRGSKALVHCKMGISRSASTVIAYLMKEKKWSLQKAYDFTKGKRSIINPNPGFWKQLEMYEGILTANWNREFFNRHAPTKPMSPMEEGEELPEGVQCYANPEDLLAFKMGKDSSDSSELPFIHVEQDIELASRSADSTEDSLPDQLSPEAGDTKSAKKKFKYSKSEGDRPESGDYLSSSTESEYTSSDELSSDDEAEEDDDTKNLASDRESKVFVPINIPDVHTESVDERKKALKVEGRRCRSEGDKNLLAVDEKFTALSRDSSASKFKPDGSWIKPASESETENNENVEGEVKVDEEGKADDDGGLWMGIKPEDACEENKEVEGEKDSKVVEGEKDSKVVEGEKDSKVIEGEKDSKVIEGEKDSKVVEGDKDSKVVEGEKDSKVVEGEKDSSAVEHKAEESGGEIERGSTEDSQTVEQNSADPYVRENIPWNPGMVRKQTKDIENKYGTSVVTKRESIDSNEEKAEEVLRSENTQETEKEIVIEETKQEVETEEKLVSSDSGTQVEKDVAENDQLVEIELDRASESPKASPEMRKSVYEEEEIDLPEGIVRKTTMEIEERNRITLDIPGRSLSGRNLKRSSSLKSTRVTPKAKDRDNERRKTCIALLSPTHPDYTEREQSDVFATSSNAESPDTGSAQGQAGATFDQASDASEEEASSQTGSVKVYKFMGEELTVQEGLVRKQTMDIESKSQEPLTKPQIKTETGATLEYCSNTADSSVDSKQASLVTDSVSKAVEKSSTDKDKKVENNVCSDVSSEKAFKKEVKQTCNKGDGENTSLKGRPGPSSFFTPIKKQSKPESRFDPETLELIREIGSALLNSPAKSELEESEKEDLKEGDSLVSHYVKKIERISGVAKRKPRKEIIIIDKNDSTEEKKSQPGSPSGKTAMTHSAYDNENKPITSKWSPVAKKQTLTSQSSKEREESGSPQNKSANPKWSPVSRNNSSVVEKSSPDITAPDKRTKIVAKSEESHIDKSDLTLNLKSAVSSGAVSDTNKVIEKEEDLEVCSVKKLLGKFEMPEQASGKVTPVFGSPSILSPCSNTPGAKSDTSNSSSRTSPCSSNTSETEVRGQGHSFSRSKSPLLHRKSEPVISLSDKSVTMFETKLKEMGTSLYNKSPLREESETEAEKGQGEGGTVRPKSASYGPAAGRKLDLRKSHTLTESRLEEQQGFTWEGKKVRKLYGKTHPLAKLEGRTYRDSARNSPFYNTM